MKHATKIEWTHVPGYKGETWNPVTGCSHVSTGCKFCYAEREWPRLAGNPKTVYHNRKFTDVESHEERLGQPLRWDKPRGIFVNSMSDMFHEDVPFDFIDKVMAVAALCPQHIFIVLTKRPERMAEYFINNSPFSPGGTHPDASESIIMRLMDQPRWVELPTGRNFPRYPKAWPLPNLWLGVSIENQDTADDRIPKLLQCPAAVRFVSYEPALGPVDFERWLPCPFGGPDHCGNHEPTCCQCDSRRENNNRLNWVIAGGESGPQARPAHPSWYRLTRDQCALTKTPFFFKQRGEWIASMEYSHRVGHENWSAPFTHINIKGETWEDGRNVPPGEDVFGMARVGKKNASDTLAGKQYHQFPEVRKCI